MTSAIVRRDVPLSPDVAGVAFHQSWMCSRATPDGRITLANMRLIVARGEKREERQLRDEVEVRTCLRDLFGVEFGDSVSLARLV